MAIGAAGRDYLEYYQKVKFINKKFFLLNRQRKKGKKQLNKNGE